MPSHLHERRSLLDWQYQVVQQRARYNVLSVGRRGGKTILMQDLCEETMFADKSPVGYFCPTYQYQDPVWDDLVQRLSGIPKFQKNVQKRSITVPGGGRLEMWSLDNPDAGRGRKYKRAIIDEAGFVVGLTSVWNNAIRPTLMDMQGDAWFVGTPQGRNGFWELFERGRKHEKGWRSWLLPTMVNPYILPEELEEMKASLPERTYRQEVLAQFLTDAGGVFPRVAAQSVLSKEDYRDGHRYVGGLDWGKQDDFTVLTVFDITERPIRQVAVERFNQISWEVQRARITGVYHRYHMDGIVAERNSIGDPNIEALQSDGLYIKPWNATNSSKALAICDLTLALERGDILLLDDEQQRLELLSYEATRTPGGNMRYGAPRGMHDDCVISVMLGWAMAHEGTSLTDGLNATTLDRTAQESLTDRVQRLKKATGEDGAWSVQMDALLRGKIRPGEIVDPESVM